MKLPHTNYTSAAVSRSARQGWKIEVIMFTSPLRATFGSVRVMQRNGCGSSLRQSEKYVYPTYVGCVCCILADTAVQNNVAMNEVPLICHATNEVPKFHFGLCKELSSVFLVGVIVN